MSNSGKKDIYVCMYICVCVRHRRDGIGEYWKRIIKKMTRSISCNGVGGDRRRPKRMPRQRPRDDISRNPALCATEITRRYRLRPRWPISDDKRETPRSRPCFPRQYGKESYGINSGFSPVEQSLTQSIARAGSRVERMK